MFQIDDDFLTSIGYDVTILSDEQKQQYIDDMTQELSSRISDRFMQNLDDEQVDEFNDIQENHDRALRWLNEFHADYKTRDDYQAVRDGIGDDAEAESFYATALWMRDAVPNYGGLIQEEMTTYQAELIQIRQIADDAVAKP